MYIHATLFIGILLPGGCCRLGLGEGGMGAAATIDSTQSCNTVSNTVGSHPGLRLPLLSRVFTTMPTKRKHQKMNTCWNFPPFFFFFNMFHSSANFPERRFFTQVHFCGASTVTKKQTTANLEDRTLQSRWRHFPLDYVLCVHGAHKTSWRSILPAKKAVEFSTH